MSLVNRSGATTRQAIRLATTTQSRNLLLSSSSSTASAAYHALQAARNVGSQSLLQNIVSLSPLSGNMSTGNLGQIRGLKTVDFMGVKESVYERSDWPLAKLQDYFKDDTLAVIGYGSQGHGQGLNLRDNGLNVIVGVREGGESWTAAIADGWVPGETLFPIEEAISRGTVIMNLLSDAAQSQTWPKIRPLLTPGKTLYFSHGFSAVFAEDTHVNPPSNIDVILVAPKGSGKTVRTLFKEGRGINSSVAVWQDVTGKAKERVVAMGVGIGSGYLYETTFEKEVYSDLVGERGALMGGLHGLFLAQYNILRENGHTPSEAYNETVEELTQSLAPYLGEHGMDMLHAACSTTARRGALDWAPEFEKATRPVLERLYASVKDGTEARKALEYNGRPTYRQDLAKELEQVENSEIWQVGKIVRGLRPERVSQEHV